jgi:glycosyltransferase involved in cell wall biosynthesis
MSRRLLIVSRAAEPRGGADRIVVDLCRGLPSRGWDVVLGLTRGKCLDNPEHYRSVHGDLPITEIDGSQGSRRSRLAAIRAIIEEVNPHAVLTMRVFDAMEATIREKMRGRSCRLIAGVRAYEPPYFSDVSRYRESIDAVVTSGELIAEACRTLCGIDPERVVSIGGGVAGPKTKPLARTPCDPVRLIYAGRLCPDQKRILDVVALLDELDRRRVRYRLVIAGSGPAEDALRTHLAARLQSGDVCMTGWVSPADLYERFYPDSDLFVHFAAWEGITIAPREAMAHGVVPVVSQFTGQRTEGQLIDGVTALTFPVGDTCAAADCIERLLGEPGLMARLSANAAASQTGPYSFEGALYEWAKLLDQSLESPVKCGVPPRVPDCTRNRFLRNIVPSLVEDALRSFLHRPIQHRSAGSEWPTSSGLIQDDERARYLEFAKSQESKAGNADRRRQASPGSPRDAACGLAVLRSRLDDELP